MNLMNNSSDLQLKTKSSEGIHVDMYRLAEKGPRFELRITYLIVFLFFSLLHFKVNYSNIYLFVYFHADEIQWVQIDLFCYSLNCVPKVTIILKK